MENNTQLHDNDLYDPELILDFWDEVFERPGDTMSDDRTTPRLEADDAFDALGPEHPGFNFWDEVLDSPDPSTLDPAANCTGRRSQKKV